MNIAYRLAMVSAAILMSLYAQRDVYVTLQMANGRAWNSMGDGDKIFYVSGVKDSYMQAALRSVDPDSHVLQSWAQGFLIADYVRELNKLYGEGENVLIPLPFAIDYCTAKLNGKTPKEQLENFVSSLRTMAVGGAMRGVKKQ